MIPFDRSVALKFCRISFPRENGDELVAKVNQREFYLEKEDDEKGTVMAAKKRGDVGFFHGFAVHVTNSFSKFPLSLLFCDDVTVSSSERRKTATLMAS